MCVYMYIKKIICIKNLKIIGLAPPFAEAVSIMHHSKYTTSSPGQRLSFVCVKSWSI